MIRKLISIYYQLYKLIKKLNDYSNKEISEQIKRDVRFFYLSDLEYLLDDQLTFISKIDREQIIHQKAIIKEELEKMNVIL